MRWARSPAQRGGQIGSGLPESGVPDIDVVRVPKDSLIGDDVRQYRRGRRLAIGTITSLTVSTPVPGPTDLVATTPSGDLIIVVDEQLLRWDLAGKMTTEPLVGAGSVNRAALSPDGRLLATASGSSGVILWDVPGAPQCWR